MNARRLMPSLPKQDARLAHSPTLRLIRSPCCRCVRVLDLDPIGRASRSVRPVARLGRGLPEMANCHRRATAAREGDYESVLHGGAIDAGEVHHRRRGRSSGSIRTIQAARLRHRRNRRDGSRRLREGIPVAKLSMKKVEENFFLAVARPYRLGVSRRSELFCWLSRALIGLQAAFSFFSRIRGSIRARGESTANSGSTQLKPCRSSSSTPRVVGQRRADCGARRCVCSECHKLSAPAIHKSRELRSYPALQLVGELARQLAGRALGAGSAPPSARRRKSHVRPPVAATLGQSGRRYLTYGPQGGSRISTS